MELLFATDRCHTLDDPWQDRAIAVRFNEEEASVRAVADAVRDRPIDGTIAVGDRPVVLAARIAHALGLPGNPPDAAAASANKFTLRSRLTAAGLPAPWFHRVALTSAEQPPDPDGVTFPCIVKPLGLSGSRGVIRANTPAELRSAIARVQALLQRKDVRALRAGLEDALLIEGYIEGREFALEGVLTRGVLQVFAIFDKPDPLDGPFFEETIYVTPSSLTDTDQRGIISAVQRASRAIGLVHGPIHAECRWDGATAVVLEIAARPIGGLCSRVLRFEPEGRSLEEILLAHASGRDISHVRREAAASAVMMIPIPRRGIFRRVEGEEAARRLPLVEDVRITAKMDQLLEPLPEGASYLGFIFARAATPPQAVAALREAHACLHFQIDPAIDVVTLPGPDA